MKAAPRNQELDLDCFLEVEGASATAAEEMAIAVAEEVESWVRDGNALDAAEAECAYELARQMRVVGWMVSVDSGEEIARLIDQLEILVFRAGELTVPPAVSGIRRRLTPPRGLAVADLFSDDFDSDEDLTQVRKSKWDVTRSTNRVLETGPSSQRRPGSNPSLSEPPPASARKTPPPQG
ncbi:MAG: hypothetical protein U0271_41425 [Polyangiaceae bacterium]